MALQVLVQFELNDNKVKTFFGGVITKTLTNNETIVLPTLQRTTYCRTSGIVSKWKYKMMENNINNEDVCRLDEFGNYEFNLR